MSERYTFGPYELLPQQRMLLRDGEPVEIRSRALSLLTALVGSAGQVLSHQDLMRIVWPETFVSEANLRVQIASLRRLLEDPMQDRAAWIRNLPGQGYVFLAPVARSREGSDARSGRLLVRHNLPAPLVRLLGREGAVDQVLVDLGVHRMVTVSGPGGIGKTSLALAVAWKMADTGRDRVFLVDLAPLASGAGLLSAIASSLGVAAQSEGSLSAAIIRTLREHQTLLVLDNCEHLVDAAADVSCELLRAVPDLRILVSSREPLRAPGEWLNRIGGLDCPASGDDPPDAASALRYPAITLFCERARAQGSGFVLTDAAVATVARICRQLDGIPLAIELAAARADMFGIDEIAMRLEDRFSLLTQGSRTALPRHRTLRATLDWSFASLSDREQTVLIRLASLKAGFSREAAHAVAGEGIEPAAMVETLSSLAAKSLLSVAATEDGGQYRLLETTRRYAEEKLTASEDARVTFRRHLAYLHGRFEDAEREGLARKPGWIETSGRWVDDVRAAVDWAFGHDGDPGAGSALAVASAPMWVALSLIAEYLALLERAINLLARSDSGHEMHLNIRLAMALNTLKGPIPPHEAALTRAWHLARGNADRRAELTVLGGLYTTRYFEGDYPAAVRYAIKMLSLSRASPDPALQAMAHRILGFALHRLGDQVRARQWAERALLLEGADEGGPLGVAFFFRHNGVARAQLGSVLWLRGHEEQAQALIRQAIEEITFHEDPISLCYVLAQVAIPVSLWSGNDKEAERLAGALIEQARLQGLPFYLGWGRAYANLLDPKEVPMEGQVAGLFQLQKDILASCSGTDADPMTMERAEKNGWGYCAPEILRRRGERLLSHGQFHDAERLFDLSLAMARRQDAVAWELRTACSLAHLHQMQDDPETASRVLSTALERLPDGADSVDRRRALGLLHGLGRQACLGDVGLHAAISGRSL